MTVQDCIALIREEAAKQTQLCVDATDLLDETRYLNCSETLHAVADRIQQRLCEEQEAEGENQ